ncbi:general stress protein [Sporosarcina sp. GW1-11]|uniref:general stress protein n=1 Tax=Sporosarcina sp. GW1-11 TaxID=2899126 RepID=UPI00294E16F5|nr:general stress protein [Sporosarcina sp. GW1-11]MDV6379056.1 general stress protein [Sporosarcina sp. GW1-11]
MHDINNKTFIGVFYNDSDLLDKIDKLKLTGYLDDNIYVIAKNETDIAMLRSRTAADVHAAYDSWADHFMGFLTGENHIKKMMYDVGMNDSQVNRYYEEVQHGGMLLYVDEGWAYNVYTKDEIYYKSPLASDSPHAFSTIEPHIDSSNSIETNKRVQHFAEIEPSYGGYEPLKNPPYPESLAASKRSNAVMYEENPKDFPRN